MSETTTPTKEQINEWKAKAEKWDKLGNEIAKYYESEDDEGNDLPPEKEGDLCDIGLEAAKAFGWL